MNSLCHESHEEIIASGSMDLSFARHIHRRGCFLDICDWAHQNKFGRRGNRLFCVYQLPVFRVCAVLLICLPWIPGTTKVSYVQCCRIGNFGCRIILMASVVSTFLMPSKSSEPILMHGDASVSGPVGIYAVSRVAPLFRPHHEYGHF